ILILKKSQRIVPNNTCVIDQQVNALGAFENFFRERGTSFGVTDINGFRENRLRRARCNLCGCGSIPPIGKRNGHSRRGQSLNNGSPDTTASTSDQSYATVQARICDCWRVHPEIAKPPSTTRVWPVIMAASGKQSR